MKKIAVIGKGKTGQAVISVLGAEKTHAIFSRANPLTLKTLAGAAAAIIFVPAAALPELLPILLESKVPVVCGTTGFVWPIDFSAQLKASGLVWITGSNFSPGMNFMFTVANLLQRNRKFLGDPELRIHEIHHAQKLDSPSGTALRLNEALGGSVKIEAERFGEHRGLHELEINSAAEKLFFRHEALDRKAFGEGAVFAAEELLPKLSPGLYSFESLIEKRILEHS
jgi:4-hydroxy-tetrahydrodipicolinate reductase